MAEKRDGGMNVFVELGCNIPEVLQAVENALIDAGYDDFVVPSKHGSFHWQTTARALAEAPEPLPGDELEH